MKKTMKGMMMKSMVIFCLIPFFFLWLSFATSSTMELQKNIESEQKNIVRLLGASVENYFYKMEETMGTVTSDTKIHDILKNVDRNKYGSELYNAYEYIRGMIGKTCFSFSELENVILTNTKGDYYSTALVKTEMLNYIKNTEEQRDNLIRHQGKAWVMTLEPAEEKNRLILAKPIMDMQEIQYIGMMYFVLKSDELGYLLKQNLNTEEAVLLTDRQGQAVYAENGQLIEESGIIVTQSETNDYGLSVITGISMKQNSYQLLRKQILLLLIFVSVTILVLALIQYIYKKINGEIQKLMHSGEENPSEDTTYFEIRQLNHEIMSLVQKNNEGEKKIIKLMNHCDTVNLDKLQAQINPHFLYNTLTSIKYIAMENGQKQISELITALIKLLRSTINREGIMVPLSKETDNVKNYMCIQNVIYKGNVDFEIDIPEKLSFAMVPNFILQPLVENCLFHGIHPEEKGGKICIRALEAENGLSIQVEDNGDGFSDDCLVNMMGAENNKEMMTNFGLKGVQQKIQLVCGAEYGLFVTSTKNLGSTVEIRLPYRTEGDVGNV